MSAQVNKKIVLASGNKGKIAEIQACLPNMDLIPQSLLQIPDVEETGLTFVENAILKARHATHFSGLPAIADDSGLVVAALDGEPGIYSQRYAQRQQSGLNNNEFLLHKMQNIPWEQRHAYFYCVIVLMQHALDPAPLVVSASWHGMIAFKAEGEHGFGYDPVFYLPELQTTAAMLSPEEKNKFSHRGQALQILKSSLS